MNTPKPEPKTRGYDSTKHSALPYVDKQYKALLDQLAESTGRTKKRALELAIGHALDSHLAHKLNQ